jgi:hypothetical protein
LNEVAPPRQLNRYVAYLMDEITSPAITTETHFRPLQPPKIGGWLIVIAVGLVLSLLQNLTNMLQVLAPLGGSFVWVRLTDPTSPVYHPYWKTVIIYDAIAGCLYVVMNMVAIILFFGKRRLFPKLTVAFIPSIFLLSLVAYFLEGMIPAVANTPTYIGQSHMVIVKFIALHVWIPYFLVSKRVKATFVL